MRGDPWAVPAALLALVLATAAAWPMARRMKAPVVPVWLFLASVGGFLAATVTPTAGAGQWSRHAASSFAVVFPSPAELHSLNVTSLNVLLGVPLGLAAVLLAGELRRWWPLLTAVTLPLTVEVIQHLLPVLGRSGLLLPDVIDNVIGLAVGGFLGALVFGVVLWWRRSSRQASPAATRR